MCKHANLRRDATLEKIRFMIVNVPHTQGLFGVTAVGEVGNGRDGFDDDDDEDDGGDGEDDDELSEKVRCDAPAGASRVPQQMAMTLGDHGNVRKKIYTCSPE